MSMDPYYAAKEAWLDTISADTGLPSLQRASVFKVAWYLAKSANREKFDESGTLQSWPSVETMAGNLAMSKHTVIAARDLLYSHQYIAIEVMGGGGKGGRGNYHRYWLLLPKSATTAPFKGSDEERVQSVKETVQWTPKRVQSVQERVQSTKERVQSLRSKGCNQGDQKGAMVAPDSLNRLSESESLKRLSEINTDTTSEINSSIKVNARENFKNSPHPWDGYHCKECPYPNERCQYSEGCYRYGANP
jgi:hypothetical protein